VAEAHLHAGVPAPSVNLRISADAATDRLPRIIVRKLGAEFCGEFRSFGARADQAHVAQQHIPKLRKLIQAAAS